MKAERENESAGGQKSKNRVQLKHDVQYAENKHLRDVMKE